VVFSDIKLSVFGRSAGCSGIWIQIIRLLRVLWFVKNSIKFGWSAALDVRQQRSRYRWKL